MTCFCCFPTHFRPACNNKESVCGHHHWRRISRLSNKGERAFVLYSGTCKLGIAVQDAVLFLEPLYTHKMRHALRHDHARATVAVFRQLHTERSNISLFCLPQDLTFASKARNIKARQFLDALGLELGVTKVREPSSCYHYSLLLDALFSSRTGTTWMAR